MKISHKPFHRTYEEVRPGDMAMADFNVVYLFSVASQEVHLARDPRPDEDTSWYRGVGDLGTFAGWIERMVKQGCAVVYARGVKRTEKDKAVEAMRPLWEQVAVAVKVEGA